MKSKPRTDLCTLSYASVHLSNETKRCQATSLFDKQMKVKTNQQWYQISSSFTFVFYSLFSFENLFISFKGKDVCKSTPI
jgi:hypothetical protein